MTQHLILGVWNMWVKVQRKTKKYLRRRKENHWLPVKVFNDFSEVQSWAKARCCLVVRRDHKICPVRGKVIKFNDTDEYEVEYTTWNHYHVNAKRICNRNQRASNIQDAARKYTEVSEKTTW